MESTKELLIIIEILQQNGGCIGIDCDDCPIKTYEKPGEKAEMQMVHVIEWLISCASAHATDAIKQVLRAMLEEISDMGDPREGVNMWGTVKPRKSGGRYLVTLQTSSGRQVRQANLAEHPKGNFYWLVLPECSTHTTDVVAWMKQPEPYKG